MSERKTQMAKEEVLNLLLKISRANDVQSALTQEIVKLWNDVYLFVWRNEDI